MAFSGSQNTGLSLYGSPMRVRSFSAKSAVTVLTATMDQATDITLSASTTSQTLGGSVTWMVIPASDTDET